MADSLTLFVHIHSSLQLININIDCKYTQYNIRKCFSKFVCICFWSEKVTCMGRGHNKSNIRPVIGYSGRGFFKPSSESVLLTWENESTVTVCVLLERSKEIDTKGNSVSSEKLRKTDIVLNHEYQKVENKNSKPQSIYKHWHTKAIIQMPDGNL